MTQKSNLLIAGVLAYGLGALNVASAFDASCTPPSARITVAAIWPIMVPAAVISEIGGFTATHPCAGGAN